MNHRVPRRTGDESFGVQRSAFDKPGRGLGRGIVDSSAHFTMETGKKNTLRKTGGFDAGV